LGVNQRINDVFYKISNDMGAPLSWGNTVNLTAYDSTEGGWLGHGEMSVLIDTDDYLHILWSAREILSTSESADGGLGEYAHFWGARVFHWDELNDAIRPVKDANWDLPDSGCTGGAWNEMSLVKCMLSECDNKFYAFFIQFNDIANGIANDCHAGRFDGSANWSGTANGEIYMSVSDDGGFSWDVARNLTDTYTPYCYENDGEGLPVCESDHYAAVSRFGQQVGDADFGGAFVVDPGEEPYAGDWYLDVLYLNDKFPGSCMQNDGVWTQNPIKWFRVPCVEKVENPVLVYSPNSIDIPTWTKPSVQLTDTMTLENIGNADLTVASISVVEVGTPTGWLGVGNTGPIILGYASGSTAEVEVYLNEGGSVSTQPHVVEGYIIINSNSLGGAVDSLPVTLIIADTIQAPEWAHINTQYTQRLTFSNHGNMGNSGIGSYNMDYVGFDTLDCDTTDNEVGTLGDRADVYLYDASPFIIQVDGSDTLYANAMFGIDWFDDESFIPQEGPTTSVETGYEKGYSGVYYTSDSSIALESYYYGPTSGGTTADNFVVVKQMVYNNTDAKISGIVIGDLLDWDIPADSGSRNQSGYYDEEDLQMMYVYGYDYGPLDTLENNDCIADDLRAGGLAYYAGYRVPFCNPESVSDSIWAPQAQWTHINADWVYPTGNFEVGPLYEKATTTFGYETWEATADPTNSDSVAQDLHHVVVFGQYDLKELDTLVFVKILATTYNADTTLFRTDIIPNARAWIVAHPEIFAWPDAPDPSLCGCCDVPGDANNNGSVNILDITFEISYLYKGGPAPDCNDEADANGNGTVNILDITYLISYLYKGGPAPICGETGSK
jgi:hypothetical protein